MPVTLPLLLPKLRLPNTSTSPFITRVAELPLLKIIAPLTIKVEPAAKAFMLAVLAIDNAVVVAGLPAGPTIVSPELPMDMVAVPVIRKELLAPVTMRVPLTVSTPDNEIVVTVSVTPELMVMLPLLVMLIELQVVLLLTVTVELTVPHCA